MKIQHDVCLKAAKYLWLPILLGAAQIANAVTPAQDPLFLAQPVRPLMMLNMSNDHQLFFKLYDDYTDLDTPPDGEIDVGYMNDYDYYGYFDENKCYSYSNGVFSPDGSEDGDGYCNAGGTSNQWSGNFLNWATMTRIDAVRKILYGGKRSTDTVESTILERAFLPNDAHSFAKYFNGPNIDRLTPFGSGDGVTEGNATSQSSGITICNTTDGTGLSQEGNGDPLLRIARGNFSLWASNERWQCRWRDDVGSGQGVNNNDSSITGIYSSSRSPDNTGDDSEALGDGEYIVRVSVCEDGLEEENCGKYPSGDFKPRGLLQDYGEDGRILFGLMTGSYGKNKSGGVLRKQIGDLTNEINVTTNGTFKTPPDTGNIIDTLDNLRIYGYSFSDGTYDSDGCSFGLIGFNDGTCKSWGNPQSEIYLESLRYLAGTETPNPTFLSDDSTHISGLVTASWNDPVNNDNYCAPLNVLQFNASTSSYDGQAPGVADIQMTGEGPVGTWVDKVGAAEGIHNSERFVGKTAAETDGLCTPKMVTALKDVSGTCPDAPRLEGTYNIAGLAYYARNNRIRTVPANTETVKTYGVALASATPSVTIPVPARPDGSAANKVINILPACQNQGLNDTDASEGNCAIVDFKIIEQSEEAGRNSGKLYVNWEAAEQGGDYDSDMWGILEYAVTPDTVAITTDVIQESSSRRLGFGYVLTGTRSDGFNVHSGTEGFDWPEGAPDSTSGCDSCQASDSATTNTYLVGESAATALEFPLYYAAKWGGYEESIFNDEDTTAKETVIKNIEDPSTYFYATNPRQLEEGLNEALAGVAKGVGAATSLATDSTRLQEGSYVYQARFSSDGWTGEVLAYPVDAGGVVAKDYEYSTNSTMHTTTAAGDNRTIYTVGQSGFGSFEWSNLTDTQKSLLIDGDDPSMGPKRLEWLRGVNEEESNQNGLRERKAVDGVSTALGDIVNSNPAYLGEADLGYALLGQGDYEAYLDAKEAQPRTLFVGSNGGMLHAFDVENNMLKEIFAYVPESVYPDLADITRPNYGRQDNGHQYTVDGPLTVGDAYVDGAWKSVVVGTLGAGGKTIYALDVTDRNNPQLIFEYSEDDYGELGFMLSEPQIVRMANNEWAVVVGNGYDSADGTSQLVIIELDSGNQVTTVDTGSGSGLSGVALLGNRYGQVQYAYAGDLEGNLWKFDLTSTDRASWSVGLSGNAMFTARDSGGNVQPIFAEPTLGRNAQKDNAIMVYFGTGKYFETIDNNTPAAPRHSVYAIADIGVAHTGSRDDFLEQKTITDSGASRTVSGQTADAVSWSTQHGWYMDFDTVNGERVINKLSLQYDKLIFSTITPSASPCKHGGTSWLMEVIGVGDKYVTKSLLGENVKYESMILGEVGVGGDTEGSSLLVNLSSGDTDQPPLEKMDDTLGRQSWRQLQ